MNTVMKFTAALLIIIAAVPVYADGTHPQGIKLDGTLGNAGQLSLPGPDYEVRAEYGQQAGANLFHSFQQFNLHSDESATFSGPDSVQNIISRITGGKASWIDGKLGSAIPGADLYMLNPAGVMFGPNASLDLGGSFHVSTADYLRMGENERFYSMPHADDVLSLAAPSAFGFLDEDIASITFEGGEIALPDKDAGIRVSEGGTVSVTGGDIEIKGISYQKQETDGNGNPVFEKLRDENGYLVYEIEMDENGEPLLDENGNPVYKRDENNDFIPVDVVDANGNPIPLMKTAILENIRAPGGQISITGVASEGEIILTESGMEADFENMGNINLSDKAKIDASGDGGGSIFIRGELFVAEGSSIHSKTLGSMNGQVIDIRANTVLLFNGANITSDTEGTGRGTDIVIRAESVTGHASGVYTESANYHMAGDDMGDSGDILIEAEDIAFEDNMRIQTKKYGGGNSGNITLKAETVSLNSGTSVKGGNMNIEAENISFTGNASVSAGNIFLNAQDSVSFNNESHISGTGNIFLNAQDSVSFNKSHIRSDGNLAVEAKNVSFADNAYIDSINSSGEIKIKAQDSVSFIGRKSDELRGSYISMKTHGSREDAGSVVIEAENILFTDYAYIDAGTEGTGSGGNITLKAQDSVRFVGGNISTTIFLPGPIVDIHGYSGLNVSSEYQGEDAGDAGTVLIEAGNILFEDGAFINADTSGTGKGGSVTLKARDSVEFAGGEGSFDFVQTIWNSRISVAGTYEKQGGGDAGTLEIEADNILFTRGAYINSETLGTGKGGDVELKADDSVSFTGEDRAGSGSRIEASTKYSGPGAGDAGNVEIEAENISLADGAYINSSSYGTGTGGKITGKAENFKMAGTDSKGNRTGIYAGSENTSLLAGSGGTINISARNISMSDHASISVSAEGNGSAGNIELRASRISLDNGASVISGSGAVNIHMFDSISERDSNVLTLGDRVEVANVGYGMPSTYIFTGKLTEFTLLYKLANFDELSSFYYGRIEGYVAEVADDGEGKPASYICYTNREFGHQEWARFDTDNITVFADMSELEKIKPVLEEDMPAYSNGIIRVLDAGDGKEAVFVCIPQITSLSEPQYYLLDAIRLGRFDAEDMTELNNLPEQYSLENGDVVNVADAGDGVPSEFVFYNGEYIKLRDNVHTVEGKDGIYDIPHIKTGDLAEVSDTGDGKQGTYIFSGKEWMPLTDVYNTVPNIAGLDSLLPDPGDVAYVSDTDENTDEKNPANYVYDGKGWEEFAKGDAPGFINIRADSLVLSGGSSVSTSTQGHGDAANINLDVGQLQTESGASVTSSSDSGKFGGNTATITIGKKLETDENGTVTKVAEQADTVILKTGGSISTKATDATGGEINIHVRDRVHISNGKITSEVYGGDGKGGDIEINQPKFVILDQGIIKADAHRGTGGNIHIVSDQFVKSSNSTVSASSELGIDGSISIESPDADISGGLTVLPEKLLDAARWMKTPCEARTGESMSQFSVKGRDAAPTPANDLGASPPMPFGKADWDGRASGKGYLDMSVFEEEDDL
ncbi:MAG: filamentous hemagglutinin N-terminal domain-containing protein [Desulfobacterales bacterium]|nr:filamentous hemagglutinin N-terminal domain-containing protein [Desulfobacterales bacterium]